MNANRPFTMIAALIFAIVAAGHAIRLYTHAPVAVGSYTIPQWPSVLAAAMTIVLAVGLLREARR